MASFQEIEAQVRQGQSVLDALRIRALVDISKITGRNAIAYYSAFMTRRGDGMERDGKPHPEADEDILRMMS